MGIAALPQATVKALGSTQSIVNSVSVVKELIENALDANTRSVSVEISSNTLDVIQVKDNGHGIPPADRHSVAVRYCTSKITNEQDLERMGSLSLGFRGEALSHIAEMSSELAVTTRVDGEGAGSHLTFSRDGKLEKEQRKSHAVGTTVRVTKFLEHHPVRKQHILKAPRKIIDGILLLLHRFTFARPHVRFAFSVLKSNAAQDRWIYAPATEITLTSTALKVIGQTAVSQCQFEQVHQDGIRIEALLPKSNADTTKLKRKGEYVVLDGRPLAPKRGFGKRLLKEVKEHSGWKELKNEGAEAVFICLVLHFDCTTYDATIEPSKDDILIADVDGVLSLLRKLLDKVYPIHITTVDTTNSELGFPVSRSVETADEVMNAYKSTMAQEHEALVEDMDVASPEYDSLGTQTEVPATQADKSAYNPWTMAKINAPRRSKPMISTSDHRIDVEAEEPLLQLTVERGRSQEIYDSSPIMSTGLLTPKHDSSIRKIPHCGSGERSVGQRQLPQAQLYFPPTPFTSESASSIPFSTPGNTALPVRSFVSQGAPRSDIPDQVLDQVDTYRVSLPVSSSATTPATRTSSRKFVNKPFKAPSAKRKDPERDAWFDFPDSSQGARAPKRPKAGDLSVKESGSRDIRSLLRSAVTTSQDSPAPVLTMPYHSDPYTSTNVILSHPTALQESGNIVRDSAYDNPGQENLRSPSAARLQRRASSGRDALKEIDINLIDPRDLLLRPRTKSGRMKRAKSSMLPLERSTAGAMVHALQQTFYLSLGELKSACVGRMADAGYFEMDEDPLATYSGLEYHDGEGLRGLAAGLRAALEEKSGSGVVNDLEDILRSALLVG